MKQLLIVFFLFAVYSSVMAQQLKDHQWKHRLILLFAESSDSDSLREQEERLHTASEGIADRDLLVYRLFSEEGRAPGGESLTETSVQQLRTRYRIPADGYTFLLLGKDGTEKLRERKVVPVAQLFDRIDRMPMRRAEMRRKNND